MIADYDDVLATVHVLRRPLLTVYQHRGGGVLAIAKRARKWGLAVSRVAVDRCAGC